MNGISSFFGTIFIEPLKSFGKLFSGLIAGEIKTTSNCITVSILIERHNVIERRNDFDKLFAGFISILIERHNVIERRNDFDKLFAGFISILIERHNVIERRNGFGKLFAGFISILIERHNVIERRNGFGKLFAGFICLPCLEFFYQVDFFEFVTI